MESNSSQAALGLAFGVHRAPRPAPEKLVRAVDSEAQAINVCMRASKLKLSYIAACIGKSESYVSRLRTGKRAVPEKLVDPLCCALGSQLLRQVRDLHDTLHADMTSRYAEMLRVA